MIISPETTVREDDELRLWKYSQFIKSILGTSKPYSLPNYSKDEVIFELEIKGKRNYEPKQNQIEEKCRQKIG